MPSEAAEYLLRLLADTEQVDAAAKKIGDLEKRLISAGVLSEDLGKKSESGFRKSGDAAEKATKKVKELSESEVKAAADTIAARAKNNKAIDEELAKRGILRKSIREESDEVAKLSAAEVKAAAQRKIIAAQNKAAIDAELGALKKQTPELFQSVPDWSANANRARFQTFQLTSAFQDLAIVLQNGGTFDRALIGASNNFGVLASTAAMPVAILGTLAVIAIPTIVKGMMEASRGIETMTEKMMRLAKESRELGESNIKLADTYRTLEKARLGTERGLGTKEQIASRKSLADRIGDVAAERFDKDPKAVQAVRDKALVDENRKVDKVAGEALENLAGSRSGTKDFVDKLFKGIAPVPGGGASMASALGPYGVPMMYEYARKKTMQLLSSADVRKLLVLTGQAKPGFGGALGTPGDLKGYQDDPIALQNLVSQAIDRAIKMEVAGAGGIAKLPKDLQDDATARKKYLDEKKGIDEKRAKAKVDAEKKAAEVVQGKDVDALRGFVTPETYVDIVRTAEQREAAEAQADKDKITAERVKYETEKEFRDRIDATRKSIAKIRQKLAFENNAGVKYRQEQEIRRAEASLQEQEREHSEVTRDESEEDKQRDFASRQEKAQKKLRDATKSAQELVAPRPTIDRGGVDYEGIMPPIRDVPAVSLQRDDAAETRRMRELMPLWQTQEDLLRGIKDFQEETLKEQKELNRSFIEFLHTRSYVPPQDEMELGSGRAIAPGVR